MSKKVAILIPTFNRPDFLIRQLRYYASLKSAHPVYIGDASNAKNRKELQKEVKRLSHLVNITYTHDVSLDDPAALRSIAQIGKEPYCAYVGDDDFLVPAGLDQCRDFLEKHPDYATAQGRAAVFTLAQSGAYGALASVGDHWGRPEREESMAEERLIAFSKQYFTSLFSVHRRSDFLKVMKSGGKTPDRTMGGEMIPSYAPVAQGKSKFVDCLYLMRQVHDRRYPLARLVPWIIDKGWNKAYHIFVNEVAKAIATPSLSQDQKRQVAEEAFWHHIALGIGESASREGSSQSGINDLLRNRYPRVWALMRRGFNVWNRYFFKRDDLRFILAEGSAYYSEFQAIKKAIENNP